ncbi:magnesium transporter [Aureibacter tunicatorum]|uniref:Magnesium transporter MgtE n=1 Tax=Aureibacter tunicatorum TaxID=866807 RepID=A0AAE3XSV6_9BACT|nr:magnesium transporter [Aureibacter tunicatorum]MDR6241261.1 magnesium transporter [Aureibacter tunicatorum]BDD03521.1 magnesium transporter MgtE [Aureibacter tunicatorum]
MIPNVPFEVSIEYVQLLRQAVEEKESEFIRSSMDGVLPADITSVLEELEAEECKYVLQQLDMEVSAEILAELQEDLRKDFLSYFKDEELAAYLEEMDSDDAVDILNELSLEDREKVIAYIHSEEKISNILDLLRYDDDCAGGLMAKELIKVNYNWNVVQCIEEIRRQAENVEKVYTLYVVDDADKLMGKVSLKKIILASDHVRIKDLYDSEVVSVETYLKEEEVSQIMRKYDLEVVPVVNLRGTLVGRITIDDILDVITETVEEERQMMAGISEDVEEADSVWVLSRARLPWLVIGMGGGMLAAQFMGMFDSDISLVPALATFVPLITATGGNVGLQSSSLVLQSLANPSIFEDKLLKRLWKVLLVALMNGLVLSTCVFVINYFVGQAILLAVVVSVALFSVVLLASLLGTITPIVMDKLDLNPALASGPFITIANDLLGLGVYFSVAHLLFF